MKKRWVVLWAAIAVVGGLAWLGTGWASEELPEHPHMLVQGIEFDGEGNPVAYRKCVDLAANRALPLNAHHDHAHTGAAGAALRERAGHMVVPGAPLTPWANCSELIAAFFP